MEARKYDWIRRGVRTFIQGFIGIFALLAIPQLNDLIAAAGGNGDVVIDVTLWRNLLMASIAGGIVALVAFGQNLLEEKTAFPALLKGRASSGQNPTPDGLP